jgi:TPR repeat protein
LIKIQKFEEAARELIALEKNNNPEVNYYLGLIYMDGLGVRKNIIKAKDFFIKSKEQGFSKANEALTAINLMVEEKEEIKLQERQRKEKFTQGILEKRKKLSSSLDNKCSSLAENTTAWMACMKNESAMFSINLNSYYAMRNECGLLAGTDDTGLSYLCSNPSSSGCVGLKASQDTINACYQCNGSNLWLRVYATGTVLKCY